VSALRNGVKLERHSKAVVQHNSEWPDGTIRWIEARGEFTRDAAGHPPRNYGVMLDITERKRAETAFLSS
jgi:PAS domain S-box-containing protein